MALWVAGGWKFGRKWREGGAKVVGKVEGGLVERKWGEKEGSGRGKGRKRDGKVVVSRGYGEKV